jgi:hypothetical protein
MAKFYGSLVGAVLQNFPLRPADKAFGNTSDAVMVRDIVTLAAAPIGSLISLGFVGWEATLTKDCLLWSSGLGAGVLMSVGDVTFASRYGSGFNVATPATIAMIGPALTAVYFQPLWQQLGYGNLAAAQLVGPKCELLATLSGAVATGNLAWQLLGEPRI